MSTIKIKILTVNEARDFRTIRLSALKNSPEMFGSTYGAELDKPLVFFENCLLSSTVFGAYHNNQIIGLATLTQETGAKFSHKATLSSVFIEPEFQQKGVASRLLSSIIEHSEHNVEQILLMVANDNEPAIRLYKKFGFQTYGVDIKAMKDNGKYIDEALMKRFIA